ncbi:Histone-lysine N-methyltransferase 2C [Larimichthys crocea]|uniref:[histone H3]-lysine(4) N-methyltransferase n=1 Tax=Larimichthys crocea TaxID=215358 RepID=A0A6G0HKM4_LARCR|nr:Histone-lysine N-methyltransferase 2C [Larimichthys crocea]
MVPLSGDKSSSCSPSSTLVPTPDLATMAACDPYDSELRCFAVFRRVFVQRDEARQIAAVMNAFHNKNAIFPIGYHANRIYWSMRHSSRRCKYVCCIEEHAGQPLFKVKVVEKGYDDLTLERTNTQSCVGPDPGASVPPESVHGDAEAVPSLPERRGPVRFDHVCRDPDHRVCVETCERYTFRYGRNPLMEWPLAFNPSGSARSEPKACQIKSRLSYLSLSDPPVDQHRSQVQGSVGSIVGLVPGVISLSPWRSVARSPGAPLQGGPVQTHEGRVEDQRLPGPLSHPGLGLYAARDIEKCTMVIEYIGTIIRSEVANRKERLYESQNRGVYMFRIDNDFVIDATITGGPARGGHRGEGNKIIISSCRRIQRGEELSYDYKFDLEDDQHKIPCHCGAVNCRKWMN